MRNPTFDFREEFKAVLYECFDFAYFNGDDLIVDPSRDLGKGQVSIFTIDAKLINSYQLLEAQKLTIPRPKSRGIYILSFSGKQGVCSQQVFVP